MIELKRSGSTEPDEMVDLFSIEGVVYQVPAKPRVNVALQYLDNMRQVGDVLAQMMLLEKLLGEKGYKALCEYDELSPDDLAQVSEAAARLTLGSLEETSSPNSGSGSPKLDG